RTAVAGIAYQDAEPLESPYVGSHTRRSSDAALVHGNQGIADTVLGGGASRLQAVGRGRTAVVGKGTEQGIGIREVAGRDNEGVVVAQVMTQRSQRAAAINQVAAAVGREDRILIAGRPGRRLYAEIAVIRDGGVVQSQAARVLDSTAGVQSGVLPHGGIDEHGSAGIVQAAAIVGFVARER